MFVYTATTSNIQRKPKGSYILPIKSGISIQNLIASNQLPASQIATSLSNKIDSKHFGLEVINIPTLLSFVSYSHKLLTEVLIQITSHRSPPSLHLIVCLNKSPTSKNVSPTRLSSNYGVPETFYLPIPLLLRPTRLKERI